MLLTKGEKDRDLVFLFLISCLGHLWPKEKQAAGQGQQRLPAFFLVREGSTFCPSKMAGLKCFQRASEQNRCGHCFRGYDIVCQVELEIQVLTFPARKES